MRNWTKNICIVLLLCWVSWSSVVMIPRWLVNAMEWARGTLRWWGSFTIVTTTPRCFHFQRHHNHNHNNNHNHLQRHHLPHNLLSQVSFNQFFLRPLQLFSLAYCSLEYWKVRVFTVHCSVIAPNRTYPLEFLTHVYLSQNSWFSWYVIFVVDIFGLWIRIV